MGTIVITARNAARTIQRAVASAVAQGPYPIVLVDDHSSDDTVALALATAPHRIEVVRPVETRTLAFARQAGLDAIRTDIHVGLAAEDEMLPRRMDRLVSAFDDIETSIAIDEAEIVNRFGVTSVAPIPHFITATPWPVRLFERAYLPAPGAVGLRTSAARALGYDVTLPEAEDVDLLLRGLTQRMQVRWIDQRGYRIHDQARPQSLRPRRLDSGIGRALSKHSYQSVGALCAEAGLGRQITAWALASMALYRGDHLQALGFVAHIAGSSEELFSVLEPDGPCPFPEAWRIEFHAGTLLALLGQDAEAAPLLEQAEQLQGTAEGANNLGVVVARRGDIDRARRLFDLALQRYPGYPEAKRNRASSHPDQLTTHPLRRQVTCDTYSAVA